jgi:hypothetical protein
MVMDSLVTEASNSITEQKQKQADKESKDYDFLEGATQAITDFGSDTGGTSNPLVWIRQQAAAGMTYVNSILNPFTLGISKAVRGAFAEANAYLDALKGGLHALVTLQKTAVYSIQKIQNYRMTATLSAINNACNEINRLNETLDDFVDSYNESDSLEWLIDDFTDKTKNARQIFEDAVNNLFHREDSTVIIDDDYKIGMEYLIDLAMPALPEGADPEGLTSVEKFRQFTNIVNELQNQTAEMESNWTRLISNMKDSLELPLNIAEATKDNTYLERALEGALQNTRDNESILNSLQKGCDSDPFKVYQVISTVLGKTDSTLLGFDVSTLHSNLDQIDIDNIDINSDCKLVRYEAYLDDIKLLLTQTGDISSVISNQHRFIDASVKRIVNGGGVFDYEEAKAENSKASSACEDFSNTASGIFDDYNDWANDSKGLNGAIGSLNAIGDAIGDIESIMDMVLSARIFALNSFEEFLALTPTGRILLAIMECLGNEDFLKTDDSTLDTTKVVLSMTEDIESYVEELKSAMDAVFAFLNGIDASIAAFIAALTALLRFCDSGDALNSPDKYGQSPASRISSGYTTEQFNQSSGNSGYNDSSSNTKNQPEIDTSCLN